jgi:serine/threonine protein kinase
MTDPVPPTLAAGTDPSAADTTLPAQPAIIPSVDLGVLLGRGAFGAVYRGRHRTLDVDVAVKLVRAGGVSLEHALKEARLIARLDHPNLVRIHDAGRASGGIYLVLELMDGGSLGAAHSLPPSRLHEISVQLLAGLQALHDARVIHRDLKPANCLVRKRDGRVKLADLGIAAERTESLLEFAGTLPFMAPELFEDPPRYGERSDLYALGMTLASLALDSDPFPHGTADSLTEWARHGVKPRVVEARPDLAPALAALVDRLLATRPEDRPASAGEALAAILAAPVTPTIARAPAAADSRRVGPWVLGEEVYDSRNWHAFAATHVATGAPARFAHVKPGARVLAAQALILEAAARASRHDHRALLATIDWGELDGRPYVVTAPQGRSLLELVESAGPRDEAEALALAADVADAVAYLHDRALVYQVVEPGAVFIHKDARAAQLGWPVYCVPSGSPLEDETGAPRRAGIPQFMPPEAFQPTGGIDPSVDLYGIGEVLYHLCAGAPAYADLPLRELVAAKAKPATPLRERAPMITQPTARLAAELCDPDPRRRPASAAAVRDELRHILSRLR